LFSFPPRQTIRPDGGAAVPCDLTPGAHRAGAIITKGKHDMHVKTRWASGRLVCAAPLAEHDDDEPGAASGVPGEPDPDKSDKFDNSEQPARRARLRTVRRIVIVPVVAILAAVALRSFVVAPYYVPSASMEPTLHGCPGCNDDYLFVDKLSYRFHGVKHGDVVVFNRPSNWVVPDKVLVKRVIGVSGDQLVIKGGQVYRDGIELAEPYVNPSCKPATTAVPGSSDKRRKAFATIPNGDVFVMGDNRCDSEDSRVFGLVPMSKIIGRAFLIGWPLGRVHSL
jgi:signal peptidase I